MATFTKKVFKIGQSEKANSHGEHWMVLTVEGKEPGQTKQENVFAPEVRAQFSKGPGVYKITYEKNDKGYWNASHAEMVGRIPNGGGVVPKDSGANSPTAAPCAADPLASKAHVATVCIQAAVELVAAELAAGRFKEEQVSDITDTTIFIARAFMNEALAVVTNKPAEAETQDMDAMGA